MSDITLHEGDVIGAELVVSYAEAGVTVSLVTYVRKPLCLPRLEGTRTSFLSNFINITECRPNGTPNIRADWSRYDRSGMWAQIDTLEFGASTDSIKSAFLPVLGENNSNPLFRIVGWRGEVVVSGEPIQIASHAGFPVENTQMHNPDLHVCFYSYTQMHNSALEVTIYHTGKPALLPHHVVYFRLYACMRFKGEDRMVLVVSNNAAFVGGLPLKHDQSGV